MIWATAMLAGSLLWTWMYNSTGGSVLAVFHAGINAMGVSHPADLAAMVPDGVPVPWLNFLAEVTGAIPLLFVALLVVLVYGHERLTHREEVPGREVLGLD